MSHQENVPYEVVQCVLPQGQLLYNALTQGATFATLSLIHDKSGLLFKGLATPLNFSP